MNRGRGSRHCHVANLVIKILKIRGGQLVVGYAHVFELASHIGVKRLLRKVHGFSRAGLELLEPVRHAIGNGSLRLGIAGIAAPHKTNGKNDPNDCGYSSELFLTHGDTPQTLETSKFAPSYSSRANWLS